MEDATIAWFVYHDIARNKGRLDLDRSLISMKLGRDVRYRPAIRDWVAIR